MNYDTMTKILKFSASWCQPCKQMAKLLTLIGVENMEEIDVDESPVLTSKYRIRSVPTLVVVDDEGNELNRLTGSHNEAQIRDWLDVWSEP